MAEQVDIELLLDCQYQQDLQLQLQLVQGVQAAALPDIQKAMIRFLVL